MRKFYRRRLITVSMLAFLILFTLVISGMFLFSFLQMESETSRTVQSLAVQAGAQRRGEPR